MITTIRNDGDARFRIKAMVIYLAIVGVLIYAAQVYMWGYTTPQTPPALGAPTPDKALVRPTPETWRLPPYPPGAHRCLTRQRL